MKTYKPHLSSLGKVSANLVAMACYLSVFLFDILGVVVAVALFIVEKNSRLVRFSAAQAAITGTIFCLLPNRLSYLMIVMLLLFAKCLFSAYHWQEWEIPILGKLAQNIVERSGAVYYNGEGEVPDFCKPVATVPQQDNATSWQSIPFEGGPESAPPIPPPVAPPAPTVVTAQAAEYPPAATTKKSTNAPVYKDPNLQLPKCMRDDPPKAH